MLVIGCKSLVHGEHLFRTTDCSYANQSNQWFINPQIEQCVVQLAISLQRPVEVAKFFDISYRRRLIVTWSMNRQVRISLFAIKLHFYILVITIVVPLFNRERIEFYSGCLNTSVSHYFAYSSINSLLEFAGREIPIDQSPIFCPFTF